MKIIIAGSRDVTSAQFDIALYKCHFSDWAVSQIVTGACPRGADEWARRFAITWDYPLKEFPADWNAFGRAAGPMRNREMAEYGDELLAIWDGKSAGTRNMIEVMRREGKPVHIQLTAEMNSDNQ